MTEVLVTSNVGRDLLQSAAHFRTDRTAIWEYIVNSLQYTNPGVPPQVMVTIDEKKKRVSIVDNGRGMDRADLNDFFEMHGENKDRKAGNKGRGLFGTGKSAVFGIASSLRVISIKDGKRTAVSLTREEIEATPNRRSIPVTVLESEVPTEELNGRQWKSQKSIFDE